jgi:hypothetical protein
MLIKEEVLTIEEQELTREDLENLISEELCKI